MDQTKAAAFSNERASNGAFAAATINSGSYSTLLGGTCPQRHTFTAYYSTNGTTWTQVAPRTITMGSTIFVGSDHEPHSSSR